MFYLSRKSKKKESCNTRLFVKNNIIDVFQIMLEVKKRNWNETCTKSFAKVFNTLQKVFDTLQKVIDTLQKVFDTLQKVFDILQSHNNRSVDILC